MTNVPCRGRMEEKKKREDSTVKYLKQFSVIALVSLAGELLHEWIPLPVPGSIYGLVLMFVGLISGVIPYEAVKETGYFLVEIMAVMFVPAGVGLITSFSVLKPLLLPFLVIIVVSSFAVMLVSGKVTQSILNRKMGEKER